jgi:hypothetical protein
MRPYATSVCEQVLHALKSVARANNCTGEARLWALSALQVLSRCSRCLRDFFFINLKKLSAFLWALSALQVLSRAARGIFMCLHFCFCNSGLYTYDVYV